MEEAQGMMKLVEQLKDEREMLSANPSVSGPTTDPNASPSPLFFVSHPDVHSSMQ